MIQSLRSQLNWPDMRCRSSSVVFMMVALMLLVACGTEADDDVSENRQFANDPVPTRVATETPAGTPTEAPSGSGQTPKYATPETILRTRGAPSTLYMVSGSDFVALTPGQDAVDQNVISLPNNAEVLGFDASPTGDRVGVLMVGSDGAPFVQFFAASGESIGGPYRADASATPEASPAASPVADGAVVDGPVSITWIPQESGVVAVYGGQVISVDVEGGAQRVDTSNVEGDILFSAVSPMGDRMLVQSAQDDGTQHAYLVDKQSGDVRELRALRTDQGFGISELVWLPTGNGVLFVEGEIVDDVVMRGQLFSYHFRNEVPTLVATSGQGGPSGAITNVAVSADGYSVAYDVSIRDMDEWSVHSMWVRSLKEDVPGIQVPVDAGRPVTRLSWTEAGLFWAQDSGDGLTLNLVPPSGEVQSITPGASPEASPLASPVTSVPPLDTPMASPAMTPVG